MATTTLGNKAVGSIIQLKENGKLVSFYVAKHNYENSLNGMGRTLVVRKDCYEHPPVVQLQCQCLRLQRH